MRRHHPRVNDSAQPPLQPLPAAAAHSAHASVAGHQRQLPAPPSALTTPRCAGPFELPWRDGRWRRGARVAFTRPCSGPNVHNKSGRKSRPMAEAGAASTPARAGGQVLQRSPQGDRPPRPWPSTLGRPSSSYTATRSTGVLVDRAPPGGPGVPDRPGGSPPSRSPSGRQTAWSCGKPCMSTSSGSPPPDCDQATSAPRITWRCAAARELVARRDELGTGDAEITRRRRDR